MHSIPYTAGNPVKGEENFFGREDIFQEVMRVLRNPQSNAIVLYGQRRIGKTSVLLELEQRLESSGQFTPVYFDLQDKAAKPLADILFELAYLIADKTRQKAPDRANFDSYGDYFRKKFLPEMAQQARSDGLVLLFDEFDVLETPDGRHPESRQAGHKFFPYLRQLMTDVMKVHFGYVIGRRPEELSPDKLGAFKSVPAAHVSLLDRETTESVVRQSERNGSLEWSNKAVEKVWEWTQGHPFLTQLLCSVVWNNAHDSDLLRAPIEAKDVEAAVGQALESGAMSFAWIWKGLPPAEHLVMSAMAEAGDVIITQENLDEILNRSGARLIMRELKLAPDALVKLGLLRPVDGDYRFAVPLIRRWIATNQPLRRVKEELDRINPIADKLFDTGLSFYHGGRLSDAENKLRESLQINPNHLKSRLLLGTISLVRGKASEAVTLLEEAYKYDQESVQAELIRALLAKADDQSDDEKLTTYERILQIDPKQQIAIERQKAIWLGRGQAALKRNDLEAALDHFRKAGSNEYASQVLELKRERDRENKMASAARYEANERWEDAISLYESLLQEYPNDPQWKYRLESAKSQIELAKLYKAAIEYLQKGDNKTAQRLLGDVIYRQPNYKEAALYLYSATENLEADGIKSAVRSLTATPETTKENHERGAGNQLHSLSPWKPFDYLGLIWWIKTDPAVLDNYRNKLGEDKFERQVGTMVSNLIWWPLWAGLVWLWAITSDYTYAIPSLAVIIAWQFSRTVKRWLYMALLSWLLTFWLAHSLTPGTIQAIPQPALLASIVAITLFCSVALVIRKTALIAQPNDSRLFWDFRGEPPIKTNNLTNIAFSMELNVPAGLVTGALFTTIGGGPVEAAATAIFSSPLFLQALLNALDRFAPIAIAELGLYVLTLGFLGWVIVDHSMSDFTAGSFERSFGITLLSASASYAAYLIALFLRKFFPSRRG